MEARLEVGAHRRRYLPPEVRPIVVGVVAAVTIVVFVGARLVLAAHDDASRFVVAGTAYVDRHTVTPKIHVFDSVGYDGQFYWRLAVEPTARTLSPVRGVRLDQRIRLSRLVYPLVAWIGAAGQPGAVIWSLIAVNIVAFGVLAGLAAALARDHGSSVWTGLAVAASSGLVMSISRDLCEVVMVAALVGGVLALHRGRFLLAGLAFSVAVLTHEQVVLVVAVFGVGRLYSLARDRARPGPEDLAWSLPGVAFVAVQLIYRRLTGKVPVLAFGGKNLTVPFADLGREVGRYLSGDIPKQSILFLPQLALVVVTVIVALRSRSTVTGPDRWMIAALCAASLMGASLSDNVWRAPGELRQVVIVPTVAWIVVIVSRRRAPALLVVATGAVWVLTAGLRVLAI
jgi:hypothetical protein